jgi:glycogen operon protein
MDPWPATGAQVRAGTPYPLGATPLMGGVNFSLYSAHATQVELLLFDRPEDPRPSAVIALDPARHRTYHYWHVWVAGIGPGQLYGYRVYGLNAPSRGLRFDPTKVLLDPYARAVAYGRHWCRAAAMAPGDNAAQALKAAVPQPNGYDWEGDQPLQRPMGETVIYELHVKGYTAHPTSGVPCPGTYAGLIDKIPYLHDLGVTAVELLPVQQFDEQEVMRRNPLTGAPLKNYWGYAPVAYFAPHLPYTCSHDARYAVNEFRDMIKALHRAGIEVILDVVFNHTAEGGEMGPTISFRGLENPTYYMLKPNRRLYQDFTGCGNTLNGNHSVVRRLIRECLRYWVQEMHVDGFRFDLASVLSRDQYGDPISDAPILLELDSDPARAGTKLIAEAGDAAGRYQLGAFTGQRWAEWNGQFRDDLRRFVRGDTDAVRAYAWRMTGSFDVFRQKPDYVSHQSINYITCHDGFTLRDLVSYNDKHNAANGENGADGADHNLSCNHGAEGPTDDPEINRLRLRQSKNLLALLMLARGTPMLLAGDEFGRTQGGNNNAYCQDNAVSWVDWRLADEHAELLRFARELIALRRHHATLTQDRAMEGRHYEQALHEEVSFHGINPERPDWGYYSHSLGIWFRAAPGDVDIYVAANAYTEPLTFGLPGNVPWRRVVDTALEAPGDVIAEDEAQVAERSYTVAPRSVAVFLGQERRPVG